jgi:hypothetical protein
MAMLKNDSHQSSEITQIILFSAASQPPTTIPPPTTEAVETTTVAKKIVNFAPPISQTTMFTINAFDKGEGMILMKFKLCKSFHSSSI